MKKLVVLILCLTICTGLACSAQQPDVIAQETEKTPDAPAAGTTPPTEENILIQPENQETGEPGENGSVENTQEPTEDHHGV